MLAGEATAAPAATAGQDSARTFASSVHHSIHSAAHDITIPFRTFHRRLMLQVQQDSASSAGSPRGQQPERAQPLSASDQQQADIMDASSVQLTAGTLTHRSLQQASGDTGRGGLLGARVMPKVPRLTICDVTGGINCPPSPAAGGDQASSGNG
jgi:hypothetical protein